MTQKKKLSRRERERLRQRQDMLAAALELFSQRGYHNVSMNEIAEKAEFAVGTLYKFFENKEDLYKSLMLEEAAWFHAAMTKALDDGEDEIEKLRNLVRAKGATIMEKAAVVRLYHSELRGAAISCRAGLYDEVIRQLDELRERVAAIFESGIKRKLFKKIAEPLQLSLALESICSGFIFLWLEDPEKYTYPDDPDVILNILFKGLVDGNGLQTRPPAPDV